MTRIRLILITLVAALSIAAPALAAPQWLPPTTISPSGTDARLQQVAVDAQGDTAAVWELETAPTTIQAADRPAGGAFSAPQTLSDPAFPATTPAVAVDSVGDAVAVWLQSDGANNRVMASYRPAGGAFGPAQTLSPAGYNAAQPHVAMGASGDSVVVWQLVSGASAKIQVASAPVGGLFGAAADLVAFGAIADEPQVAMDRAGDAIVVWDGTDGANVRIEAAVRPVGGSFAPGQFLSAAGDNAGAPQVAFDAQGDALAAWRFDGSPASTAQASYRPAGGSFAAPQTASVASSNAAQAPDVAFDGSGAGIVVYQQSDGTNVRIHAGVRAPGVGGSFAAPQILDAGGQDATSPHIGGDGLGGTIVVWYTFNGMHSDAQASVRPVGGSFSAVQDLVPPGAQEDPPQIGVDGQGNGYALLSYFTGSNYQVQAACYAASGPQLRGLIVPRNGIVGQPLTFAVAPVDTCGSVSATTIAFGDGSSAAAATATHAYSAAGTYTVTVSSTDTFGNTTQVSEPVTILAPRVGVSAAAELALACTSRHLVLTNVVQSGGHVLLAGAASPSLVGAHVTLLLDGRSRVATVTVAGNGLFSATVPLPARRLRSDARYVARAGGESSLSLKLTRRLVTFSVHSAHGRITIAGDVVLPLTHPVSRIALQQMISCTRTLTIAHVRPSRGGRFSVTVDAPLGAQAAIYRLTTDVRHDKASAKAFATYSLPQPVEIG